MVVGAGEVYPDDAITLSIEANAGLFGDRPFAGGQALLTIDPGPAAGVLRLEHQAIDRRAAARKIGVELDYRTAVAVGVRVVARDAWRVVAEGKQQFRDDGPAFQGTILFSASTPGEPLAPDRAW